MRHTRLLRRCVTAALLLSGTANSHALEELDSAQLQQQSVADALSPQTTHSQLDTLETVEEQQRHLPDADYVARPQLPRLQQDTGVSATQQQFLQSLINTLGNAAEGAR